ncbi:hypothetical protein NE235_17625 [Actinoallomurus spadix]|uniref:CU044_5270 family protein n=1 Tax=Actinoallomurus spadix TaxID=79912 RepID=A0ABP3H1J1_9ACTN|nr:hypothetical protein [Actinoallomurus spadix]MCO5987924.1 hypothetical protein [Actinoallomurus spadix]
MTDLMRVVGELDDHPAPPSDETASPPGFRRGRSRLGVGVPLGLAVTGAAVAVALSVGCPPSGRPRPHTPTGGDILRATAAAADRGTGMTAGRGTVTTTGRGTVTTTGRGAGAATGRYWRVVETGRYTLPAGGRAGEDPIEVRVRDERRLAGPGGGRSAAYRRCLTSRPLTLSERAAYLDRPSQEWPVETAAARICAAGSGPAARNAALTAATDYRLAGVPVSQIWLDHLSTEPAVLRRQVEAKLATAHLGGLAVLGHVVLPQLTTELPLRPEIRAAVLRMMAGLPGVRATGAVRDALGRTGVGVAISGLGLTTTELRWIVDPRGGGVLGVQEVTTGHGRRLAGAVVAEKAYASAGWTNDAPESD